MAGWCLARWDRQAGARKSPWPRGPSARVVARGSANPRTGGEGGLKASRPHSPWRRSPKAVGCQEGSTRPTRLASASLLPTFLVSSRILTPFRVDCWFVFEVIAAFLIFFFQFGGFFFFSFSKQVTESVVLPSLPIHLSLSPARASDTHSPRQTDTDTQTQPP